MSMVSDVQTNAKITAALALVNTNYDAINSASSALISAENYASNASNITTGTLTTSVIPILPSGLIPAITSGQIIGLLNTTQIPVLSTSNLPSITSAQIVGLLLTSQIPALTSNQITGLLGSTTYDAYGTAANLVSTTLSNLPVVLGQNDSVTGTSIKLITSITMFARTYNTVYAVLGCLNNTDTATLTIYSGTTLLATLSNTGVPAAVNTSAFTLLTDTQISFYLTGSSNTTNSFVYGIEIK